MKVSRRVFTVVVLAVGAAPALTLCVANGFFPAFRDINDPLGRPSALSQQVIASAERLDKLAAELEPKHAQLAIDIQALQPLSDDLGVLADRSVELSPLAAALTNNASNISEIAAPLPDGVADITARVDEADSTVTGLVTAVGSVSTELQHIRGGLTTMQSTLQALGPTASGIAETLATIEEEASHVQVFGPLLAVIGPPFNRLGIPPLGIESPALPPLPITE
ncbi:hypothetical protein JCM9803A_02780 [Rhodococcus erythropolis]